MGKLIKAEFYKIKHTNMMKIHMFFPLLFVVGMMSYFSFSPLKFIQKLSLYIELMVIVYPVIIGMLWEFQGELEQKAGNYIMITGTVYKKSSLLASKLVMMLLLNLMSITIVVFGFKIGCKLISIDADILSIKNCILLIGIILLCQIIPYIIHMILGFAFPKGVSIGVGVFELLFVGLFMTGLGDGLREFVPATYTIIFFKRFLDFMTDSMSCVNINYMAIIVISMVVVAIGAIWSNKYEGRKFR